MTAAAMAQADYLDDPQAIYARSRQIAEGETDLRRIPAGMHDFALWLVHATGDPGLADTLRWTEDAVVAGAAALRRGAAVLTDSRMVAAGVDRSRLPARNLVLCTLGLGGVAGAAGRTGGTRSAAGVERWQPWLGGAVVAIGNAPTALFRLLEGLREGWPRPAIVLGFPVGFVGSAEAKEALVATTNLPYIGTAGRRGGSACAAAAINALSRAGGADR